MGKILPAQAYNQINLDGFSFRVRDDWELTLVADSQVVKWPIVAVWDNDGHLLVAESAGVKQSVQEQLVTKPHRIVRLVDEDRDGSFERRVVVADQLSFPEGLMVYGKHLLVSAPPEIWKLTDHDEDGIYESKEVWHDGKTLTHCANDLHGPFFGPEGWVYWSKSAFAQQSFPLRQSFVQNSSASHLYRKPFDSQVADRVLTGGMDNLVHIAFDQNGDRFFVSTFLHHPGNGLRDGIGHGVYGSVFGKDHAVLDGHPRTGPLMLPMVELGPAAPAGLIVQSSEFDARSSTPMRLLVAQFNLQRVSEHVMQSKGSTYVSSNSDIIVGDQLDFHPVGILEDVDGSLLIVDTGGWYDLCCPSSGTEERIAPGGIYRLRKRNSQFTSGAIRGSLALDWQEIDRLVASEPVKALTHHSSRVRSHAEMALLPPGKTLDLRLVEVLKQFLRDESVSVEGRKGAFWALAKSLAIAPLQLPSSNGDAQQVFLKTPEFVVNILQGGAPDLLPSALQLTSTYAWPDQVDKLIDLLKNEDLVVVRLAAECLGRIGDPRGMDAILSKWAEEYETIQMDRVLEHSFLYALMELATHSASKADCVKMLEREVERFDITPTRAIASIRALNESRQLQATLGSLLIQAAETSHLDLSHAARLAIHSDERILANYVAKLDRLTDDQLRAMRSLSILKQAYRSPSVIRWVSDVILNSSEWSPWAESILVGQLEAYRGQTMPLEWQSGLVRLIDRRDATSDRVLAILGETQIPSEAKGLIQAISNRVSSDDFELAGVAISSIPRGLVCISEKQQMKIVEALLRIDHPHRDLAWRCLNRIDLALQPWTALGSELSRFGPVELLAVVEALATSPVVGEHPYAVQLINALDTLPARGALPKEQLEKWFAGRSPETKAFAASKLKKWFEPPDDMKAAIDELMAKLEPGDAHRGQDVFRNEKAACAACHRIGYVGGTIGPELTRIGQSRTRRDFVEAIAFPSHRIAQGYQTTSVLTEDDEVYSGLIATEDAVRLELILSATKRVSLEKASIVQRAPGTVSIMPAGIEKILSTSELSDLIAFLEQSK